MEFLKIVDILLRRKWIGGAVFLLFLLIFAAGSVLISPTYQASATLFIRASSALSSLMATLEMPQSNSSSTDEDIFGTKTALAKVRPLLDDLIAALHLKDRDNEKMDPDDLIKSGLLRKLFPQPAVTIKQDEDTALIKITASSPDAAQSAAIANKLAELYLDYNVKRAREEFAAVKTFIGNKLAGLRDSYNRALAELTEFKVNEQAADLDTALDKAISRLNDLTTSYEDNEQSLALADREIAQAEEQLRKTGKYRKETREFSKSSEMVALQSKLDDLLVQISAKGMVYQKDHPEYQQLEKEIEAVKELIKKSGDIILNRESLAVDPVYDSLSSKLVNLYISRAVSRAKKILLQNSVAEYEKKLAEFPAKSAKLAKLELNLSSAKEIYSSFLSYLNKVEVAQAIALSDTRIVEPAEKPDKQKFPKKSVMLALGLFLGLFWGVAAAFFVEYIDRSVQSPADLRALERFAWLGSIPSSRQLHNRRLAAPDSRLTEQYRMLRHALRFAAPQEPLKTILITSCGDGEGKSSLAANLALSYAAARKKTLLVDLNLRQPALHRYFSLKNRQGLADLVRGKLTAQEAIAIAAAPGLDVLPAGAAGTSADLLEAENLPALLRSFAAHYDIIILDTASLHAGSDALLLGSLSDYLICVAECGRTSLAAAEREYSRLQQAGIWRAGWVCNKCSQHSLSAAVSRHA